MAKTDCNLIYDIGLFDGSDTAYYLFRGYNVVAVDANPILVERAKERFAREIEDKRLKLLNVGISNTPGTAIFWVSDVPAWSSFDRSLAGREGVAHEPVPVSAIPFSEILKENGIPHYLKIDIEGNDKLCVNALEQTRLPKFISVEADCASDAITISEVQDVSMLDLLRAAGYKRFKLVDQARGWRAARRNVFTNFCIRLAESSASGRLRVRGMDRVSERFTDSRRIAALGFPFSPGSSGPWGDDVPGSWMSFEQARRVYLRERSARRSSFWYDWHATY